MPDLVLTADGVGRIVTFVAPGFIARVGYRARFPSRDRSAAEVLILSVVTSLPFVAFANLVAGEGSPTRIGYVTVLLVPAFLVGYLAALVRGANRTRNLLSKIKLSNQPEGSIYAQTLLRLSDEVPVTVEFKDGRKLSGTPRIGPGLAEDGVHELYLTHPAWLVDGRWVAGPEAVGEGVIVNLGEVHNIALARDPT